MIYNFYVFGRGRKVLCREETRLIRGLLLTLNSFTKQIGPKNTMGFVSYATPQYKLHSFETASGYRFVLTTDPSVPNQQECLRHIYAELFVEYVVKNPLYSIGEDVSSCPAFLDKLRSFMQTQRHFATVSA
mmetsp:Transcript_107806/g.286998  ORF Transcript_107806/g.286998 Transcript_107806/m.286998 type:complete len:131 (-) Transcript_107806:67-459(-)